MGSQNLNSIDSLEKVFGVGVYTLQEAALYARVPTQTLSRWFLGTSQYGSAVDPSFPKNERIISFLDFVQALAIRNVRVNHKITLAKIREAIERAENDHAKPYPLARKRTLYVFGADLYILNEDEEFEKLTGKNRDQQTLRRVVELYMKDISFDAATGLAQWFDAHKYIVEGTSETRTIRMNPGFRFGEPIVQHCHYSARTLWEACQAEGGIEEAAHVYGVDPVDVEAAYAYYDSLQTLRVA